jgi:hypothetical protein
VTSTTTYTQPSYDYEAERLRQEEAERQRRLELQEKAKKDAEDAKRRQEEFDRNKEDALRSMKGITENELGLKGVSADSGLDLKGIGEAENSGLGLKEAASATTAASVAPSNVVKRVDISGIKVQKGVDNPARLREELLGHFSDAIQKRTSQPNAQAQEILRSFKMKEPPSPVKNISDLAPGDVVLVAPTPKGGHLKDALISNGINLLDRWGSDNWTSPASHAAIFLGERNGKRWYLDNTSAHGPVIKEEAEFLKEYGARSMDVATLVGQPLSEHEGQELWKGAHEMRNMTTYGPSRLLNLHNDAMVCSETSRWALVRAGRRVPETQSGNAKIFGFDIGFNKKLFVSFSPSDFYEEQQYFVVHQLGMQKKEENKP